MAYPYLEIIEPLGLDQEVSRRISYNLQTIEAGNDDVLRSPFMKDEDPDSILAKWDLVFQANLSEIEEDLLNLEVSNREKFGPRSIQAPWSDREASMLNYYRNEAYIDLAELGKVGSLRRLSYQSASKLLKNSTSSGLPYLKKKSLVKDRALSEINDEREDPCVLFTRTQEGGKTRNIWGFPIKDTLKEMSVYAPLLMHQKKLSWRAALLGPDLVNIAVSRLINSMNSKTYLVSVDFSSYDASVNQRLQSDAFSSIMSLFQKCDNEAIREIAFRFANIGIITPSGVLSGTHGVPSGSTFTNEVDSIAQNLVSSKIVNPELSQIQGDDGLYVTSDVDNLLSAFSDAGFEVNEQKSHISKRYAIFLQNYYSTRYRDENNFIVGVYPVYRALNRLIFQERWIKFEDYGLSGSDYYSIRAISILENCRYHPHFENLVRFVVEHDKYKLHVTDKGLSQYIRFITETSGSQGLIINQRGDDVRGIRKFATVKLISEL
jgi:hypothetical protein